MRQTLGFPVVVSWVQPHISSLPLLTLWSKERDFKSMGRYWWLVMFLFSWKIKNGKPLECSWEKHLAATCSGAAALRPTAEHLIKPQSSWVWIYAKHWIRSKAMRAKTQKRKKKRESVLVTDDTFTPTESPLWLVQPPSSLLGLQTDGLLWQPSLLFVWRLWPPAAITVLMPGQEESYLLLWDRHDSHL